MDNINNLSITELLNLANKSDNDKDIVMVIKYSLQILNKEPSNRIAIEKIIYWSNKYKVYNGILDLLKLTYNNPNSIKIIKEIFYRESKIPLRVIVMNFYMNLIKDIELFNKDNKDYYKCGDIYNVTKKMYDLSIDNDINNLINEYMKEYNIFENFKQKYY
jgi:hypothetical protein